MKKHLSTVVLVVVFVVGLAVLLYPSVSNYINQLDATRAVSNYDEMVSGLSDSEKAELLAQASEYNEDLLKTPQAFQSGEPTDSRYLSLLNVNGDGMIGYVTISKLGVQLPIYHGTADEVLATGTGHLEGSSLPVGGTDTHAVITGHRGLPAAKLFTDLDRMEVGDRFTVTVLDQTLTYEVDQISIVEPEDTTGLEIVPGEDYVTLLTCTPYAVNTQRLLVRGVRVDAATATNVPADAMLIDTRIVAAVLGALFLVILLIVLLVRSSRRRGRAKPADAQKVARAAKEDAAKTDSKEGGNRT